jgi:hypothetical protein
VSVLVSGLEEAQTTDQSWNVSFSGTGTGGRGSGGSNGRMSGRIGMSNGRMSGRIGMQKKVWRTSGCAHEVG